MPRMITPIRYQNQRRFEQLKFEAFADAIRDALGSAETGNALVEVARNAHRAEMELAALKSKLENYPYPSGDKSAIERLMRYCGMVQK